MKKQAPKQHSLLRKGQIPNWLMLNVRQNVKHGWLHVLVSTMIAGTDRALYIRLLIALLALPQCITAPHEETFFLRRCARLHKIISQLTKRNKYQLNIDHEPLGVLSKRDLSNWSSRLNVNAVFQSKLVWSILFVMNVFPCAMKLASRTLSIPTTHLFLLSNILKKTTWKKIPTRQHKTFSKESNYVPLA